MGSIGSMIGSVGGDQGGAGLNYNADQTGLQQPVTDAMNTQANQASQVALNQQQQFLTALQGQNGIGNQANVYNQQQALANQLQGVANGTGPNPALAQLNQTTAANTANQASLMAGQRGTSSNAGLLARQVAQQGAANQQNAVGQAATQAASQQIAGLNALQSQQANLANLATNQVGQQGNATSTFTQDVQNQQDNLLNATAAYNNANVAQQGNVNTNNASISQAAAKSQQGFINGVVTGGGSALSLAHGGSVRANYADGAAPVQAPPPPSSVQVTEANNPGAPKSFAAKFVKGATQPQASGGASYSGDDTVGAGKVVGKAVGLGVKALYNSFNTPKATGMLAPGQKADSSFNDMKDASDQALSQGSQTADEAAAKAINPDQSAENASTTQSAPGVGAMPTDAGAEASDAAGAADAAGAGADSEAGLASLMEMANKGGKIKGKHPKNFDDGGSTGGLMSLAPLALALLSKGGEAKAPKPVPAMVSPGEAYISPDKLREAVATKQNPLKKAEIIPGKPKVKGDSIKNDVVPKTLEEGGVVIPNSVMQSANPMREAIKFVHNHMKNTKSKKAK